MCVVGGVEYAREEPTREGGVVRWWAHQLLARLDLSDLTPQMQDAGMDIEAVRLMQAHEWGQIGVSPAKGEQIRAAAASVT